MSRTLERPDGMDLRASFLDAMSNVSSSIAVVTSMNGGRPHGTTVTAFMSLSVDPPMVVVALDSTSDLLGHVRKTERFAVNILGRDQQDQALGFARKGPDKFAGVRWSGLHGLPVLEEVSGVVLCSLHNTVDGGDHELLLGSVSYAWTSPAITPLNYHRRGFGCHRPLE